MSRTRPVDDVLDWAESFATVDDDVSPLLDRMRGSVMTQESGGNSRAKNPRTSATGLFQVIPANIPSWTKKYVGRSYTPQEFANDPNAQETVFRGEMGKYLKKAKQKAKTDDEAIRMAAAAWYGGEGAMNRYDDPNRFRADEPSFREYTSSVLGRINKGQKAEPIDDNLWGEIDGILGDDLQTEIDDILKTRPSPTFPGQPMAAPVAKDILPLVEQPEAPQMPKMADAVPPPTAPESPATLNFQAMSVRDANSPRMAVLLTDATQLQTIDPSLIAGFTRVNTPNGILLVNKQKAQARGITDIPKFVNERGFAGLIGKVTDVGNETANGFAVVTTAPDGTELSSSIVTGPDDAKRQQELDKASFGENVIQKVVPAQEVVKARQAQQAAQPVINPYQIWLQENQLQDDQYNRQAFGDVQKAEAEKGQTTYEPVQPTVRKTVQPSVAHSTLSNGVTLTDPDEKARPTPKDEKVTLQWTKGGDALTNALDQAATEYSNRIGVDYDLVRERMKEMQPQLTRESAERLRRENKPYSVTLEAATVRELQDEQDNRKSTKAKYDVELGRRRESEIDSVAQLMALKDIGVKSVKGTPIDDVIKQERDALAKASSGIHVAKYDTSLQGIGQARLGIETPVGNRRADETIAAERAAKTQKLVDDTLSEYGSFAARQKEYDRLQREYTTRPLAAPLEFAKGVGSVLPKGVSAILKISDLIEEINPVSGSNLVAKMQGKEFRIDDGAAYQFAKQIDGVLERSQNKGLEGFYQAGDAIGQMGLQIGLSAATGGLSAPLIYGASLGASSQEEEARKKGATNAQRYGAAALGGLTAIGDALPLAWALKPVMKGGIGKLLGGFLNSSHKPLVKELGEKQAQGVITQLYKNIVNKASNVAKGVVGETAQEVFGDKKINDLYASLTYDPKRKVWEINDDDLETAFYAAIGGGAAGGAKSIIERVQKEQQLPTEALDDLINSVQGDKAVQPEPSFEVRIFTDNKGNKFELIEEQGNKLKLRNEKGGIVLRNNDRRLTETTNETKTEKVEPQVGETSLAEDTVSEVSADEVLVNEDIITPKKAESIDINEDVITPKPIKEAKIVAGQEVTREGQELEKAKEQRDTARRESELDPLTGVANRRALDRALPSAEADENTSVIAFDANSFGQINKKLGEAEGDKVLKEMATALDTAAKENGGRLFRKGGDEWTILAPKAKAEKIRDRAEELFGEKDYKDFKVSVSGVVGNTFAEADAELQGRKAERKGVAPKALTNLDRIFDRVGKDGEVTIKLQDGISREQLKRVETEAEKRGLQAAFDGNNILVRKVAAELGLQGAKKERSDDARAAPSLAPKPTIASVRAERVAKIKGEKQTEHKPINWLEKAKTEPVTNIGQLSKEDVRSLNQAVKRGELVRGKGGRFPGVKTVYAPVGFDFAADREAGLREFRNAKSKDDLQAMLKKANTPLRQAADVAQTETEAFKKWFGDSKVVDENGKPLVLHRGEAEENSILQGEFFTDSPKDASAYAELAALSQAVNENESLSEIVNDILAEEGGNDLTDLGPNTIRDIADANGIDLPEVGGHVSSVFLRMENPLDLTEFGSDVGDVQELWDEMHTNGLLDESWDGLDEEAQYDIERDYENMALYRFLEAEGIQAKAFEKGFDGVIFTDMSPDGKKTHTTWLTKEKSQAKSAIGNRGTFDPNDPSILKQAASAVAKSKIADLRSVPSDKLLPQVEGGKFVGDNLELNEADQELLRRLLGTEQKARTGSTGQQTSFYGILLDAPLLRRLTAIGRNKQIPAYKEAGYTDADLKGYTALLKNLTELAKSAKDFGITYVFDEALPEELVHQEDMRAGRTDAEATKLLRQSPFFTDTGAVFAREYPGINDQNKLSEIAAKLITGQASKYGWNKLPNFDNLKTQFLNTWADGIVRNNKEFIESNGIEAFKERFAKIYENTTPDRQGPAQRSDSTDIVDRTESETVETKQSAKEPDQRGRDNTQKEKISQTPISLREKAGIPVADRTYQGITNAEQQAFADDILDKGIENADKWFKDQVATKNLNNGTTAVVGLNLMNHYAKTREFDKMNAVADDLVPFITEVAQTLQAMTTVSAFDPEKAAAYAARIKKQFTGKDITEAEADKAVSIAQNLHDTELTEVVAKGALEQAEIFIKDLTEQTTELKKAIVLANNEKAKIDIDLKESKSLIAKLKRQVKRLLDNKPATVRTANPKLRKELTEKLPDLQAMIAGAFGTAMKQAADVTQSTPDYPRVSGNVDGLTVRDSIPNQPSIEASLDDYTILPGVREVPMSEFNGLFERTARTKQLAEDIEDSGEINPLIVVVDGEGAYILEGSHRFDALGILGKKSIPALVVLDNTSLDSAAALRQAADLDPKVLQALQDITTLDILNSVPVDDVLVKLGKLTNGQLSETEINEIHANAVESLSTPKGVTPEQIASRGIRLGHRKAARDFRNSQMEGPTLPKAARHLINAIVLEGTKGDFSDEAILTALLRKANPSDVNAVLKQLRSEFPEMTNEREVLVEADNLYKQAKESLRTAVIENNSEVELTQEDVDQIKEERRANLAARMKAQRDANTFYSGLSKGAWEVFFDTVVGFRRANLLTGVKTHARNIIGNTIFGLTEEVGRVPSWIADKGMSALTGQRTIQFVNPVAIGKSFRNIVQQDETLQNIDRQSGVQRARDWFKYGGPIEEQMKLQHTQSAAGTKFGKVGKVLDAYVNTVFNTLGAEDALFKVYAFRRSLEEQAAVTAVNEGKSGKEFTERRNELITNPTNLMVAVADKEADFMTFQNPNAVSDLFAKFKRLHPAVRNVSETLVPYDRTPTNLLLRALEFTPIGLVKAGKRAIQVNKEAPKEFRNQFRGAIESDFATKEDFLALPATEQRKMVSDGIQSAFSKQQQQEFARLFGRGTIGTSFFFTGFALAAAGLLTGVLDPGDDDKKEGKEFFERRAKGVENRSLLIPGVGRFVLPDDPLLRILTAGATFYEQTQLSKSKGLQAGLSSFKETAEDLIFDQPLMSSTKDIYNTAKKGNYGGTVGNIAGGLVPTILSDVGEVIDEKPRTSSGYLKEQNRKTFEGEMAFQGRSLRNSFMRRIPIAREYTVPESTNTISPEERGGVLRRVVRAVDPFNTRSSVDYKLQNTLDKAKEDKTSIIDLSNVPEFKRWSTDDWVTFIRESELDETEMKDAKQVLRKKALNAQKSKSLTPEEVARIKEVMPEFNLVPAVKTPKK